MRKVKIIRTRLPVELRPLRRLPSNSSPEAKERRALLERLRKLVSGQRGKTPPETMHSERCDDLKRAVRCNAVEHDLDVVVPVELAPVNEAGVDVLLGRQVDERDHRLARVVAISSEVARVVFDLADCGTISDWVGPVPDHLYSDRHPGPQPPIGEPAYEQWHYAAHEAGEDDRLYRFRFAGDGYGPVTEERFPLGWAEGSLGYKLERSLLEIIGADSIARQLSDLAGNLSAEAEDKVEGALRSRDARLAQLYRPSDE